MRWYNNAVWGLDDKAKYKCNFPRTFRFAFSWSNFFGRRTFVAGRMKVTTFPAPTMRIGRSVKLNMMTTNTSSQFSSSLTPFLGPFELFRRRRNVRNVDSWRIESARGWWRWKWKFRRRKWKTEKLGINENDEHEKVYIHDNLTLISLLLRAKRAFYC